ncbi:hypothetical protein F2R55_15175 [Alistipes onderdonkii]|nr:hypothetical protein F2R55_15175 [Alistipes onderdonkii]
MSRKAPTDAPKKCLFCEVRQGGGAYGKTPAARPSSCSWSFAHMFFPVLSPDSVDNSISFLSE